MTRRPTELFSPERPIRSDYSRERQYARRRIVTVAVLALVIGGIVYGVWGRHAVDPSQIPTITADSDYKQRPTDPGGIDIPHQDMQVYDKLEGKGAAASGGEHLLPPPETPREPTKAASTEMPAPAAAPQQSVQSAAAKPPISLLDEATSPKSVPTTVSPSGPVGTASPSAPSDDSATPPAPVAATPAAKASQAMTIDKLLKREESGAPTPAKVAAIAEAPAKTVTANGQAVAQLASLPEQAKAQQLMDQLRHKYAVELTGVTLKLVRADLGAKGVYYRIQSQNLSEDKATHLCAALKQKSAGCILVRK